MLDLTLGILTYNAPNTLKKTLKSLDEIVPFFKETLIYVNPSPITEQTLKICDEYRFDKIQVAEKNGWIGAGFGWLALNASANNILLLEDDFSLEERNIEKAKEILTSAVSLVQNNIVDKVKLRHRKNPGNPLYSRWFAGQELNALTHFGDCVHWRETPDLDFPQYCTKISSNPLWYKFKSANCNYTNNPCIFKKDFYTKEIVPRFAIENTDLETAATPWWTQQDYTVAMGDGLFCHDRKDGK